MKLNRLTKNLEMAVNKQTFKCGSGQDSERGQTVPGSLSWTK
jgi:hypothetical protein